MCEKWILLQLLLCQLLHWQLYVKFSYLSLYWFACGRRSRVCAWLRTFQVKSCKAICSASQVELTSMIHVQDFETILKKEKLLAVNSLHHDPVTWPANASHARSRYFTLHFIQALLKTPFWTPKGFDILQEKRIGIYVLMTSDDRGGVERYFRWVQNMNRSNVNAVAKGLESQETHRHSYALEATNCG